MDARSLGLIAELASSIGVLLTMAAGFAVMLQAKRPAIRLLLLAAVAAVVAVHGAAWTP